MSKGFDENTTLGVKWSKRESDGVITYPRKEDGFMLHDDLLRSETFKKLIGELKERGYDTDTLRFSVQKNMKGEN